MTKKILYVASIMALTCSASSADTCNANKCRMSSKVWDSCYKAAWQGGSGALERVRQCINRTEADLKSKGCNASECGM